MVSEQREQPQQSGLSGDHESSNDTDTVTVHIHHENYNIADYDPRWEKLKKLEFSE
jgi:hypothetical protein